jgi:hypothetical protein
MVGITNGILFMAPLTFFLEKRNNLEAPRKPVSGLVWVIRDGRWDLWRGNFKTLSRMYTQ